MNANQSHLALWTAVGGTLASEFERNPRSRLSNERVWVLSSIGVALALGVFMADAIRVADQGVEVIRDVLPSRFNWPLFCVALLLMAAPLIRLGRELWTAPAEPSGDGAFAITVSPTESGVALRLPPRSQ